MLILVLAMLAALQDRDAPAVEVAPLKGPLVKVALDCPGRATKSAGAEGPSSAPSPAFATIQIRSHDTVWVRPPAILTASAQPAGVGLAAPQRGDPGPRSRDWPYSVQRL